MSPVPQCPTFKREADSEVPEPFAAEAKFFTESRLLQRDVQIVLESCHNQNILGTILHPASGHGHAPGGHRGLPVGNWELWWIWEIPVRGCHWGCHWDSWTLSQ